MKSKTKNILDRIPKKYEWILHRQVRTIPAKETGPTASQVEYVNELEYIIVLKNMNYMRWDHSDFDTIRGASIDEVVKKTMKVIKFVEIARTMDKDNYTKVDELYKKMFGNTKITKKK